MIRASSTYDPSLLRQLPSRDKSLPTTLVHEAFLYRDLTEYAQGVVPFVEEGLEADEPVMVAVPGARLDLLRAELGPAELVQFADMTEIGRNPARIIPRIRAFIDEHPGRRVRFVGEPIWPGRSPREAVEGARHEALINLAFADDEVTIFCPYDAEGLGVDVLGHAECTHPVVVAGNDRCASTLFTDPFTVYAAADQPLPASPASATVLAFGTDLGEIRAFVGEETARLGLGPDRVDDLLLASHEAVTNSLRHAGSPGTLRIWQDGDEVISEIADGGHIRDPLAGRVLPSFEQTGGRGLWLINQLCDLVEVRSSRTGTIVRLHMRLDPVA